MKLNCKIFSLLIILLLTTNNYFQFSSSFFVNGQSSKKFDCSGVSCQKLKCKENEVPYRWRAMPINSDMCCSVCKINCDLVECTDEKCENGTFSIMTELGCCSTCVNDCSIYECPPLSCPNGAPIKKSTSCCPECP
ncbi:hypothetical protein ACTFIY_003235 [Dictyostelium cf. discoideum]